MATRGKLSWKGLEAYMERLAEAGRDVDAAACRAVQAGGQVAEQGMQERVRKDTHNLEEHLECSEPQQDGNYVYVEVGLSKSADAETARYGNAQEYGTSSMPAKSYIRTTLSEDNAKIRKAMRESLEQDGTL